MFHDLCHAAPCGDVLLLFLLVLFCCNSCPPHPDLNLHHYTRLNHKTYNKLLNDSFIFNNLFHVKGYFWESWGKCLVSAQLLQNSVHKTKVRLAKKEEGVCMCWACHRWLPFFVLEKLEKLKVTQRTESHCGKGWCSDYICCSATDSVGVVAPELTAVR